MDVITIPRKLAQKDNWVVVPRREYEEFSAWKKAVRVRLEEQWFWTPEWQKMEQEADEAIRAGNVYGPFTSHKELIAALKRKR